MGLRTSSSSLGVVVKCQAWASLQILSLGGACGAGGDLRKWQEDGFHTLFP